MKRLILIVIPILIAASANASVQQKQNEPHQMHDMAMMQNCPMMLDSTDVAVVDTPAGIAVTITTTKPENVAELQRRVQQMSVMHNTLHESKAPNEAMMQGRMMPGNITYEAIPNGARLTLAPKDPANISEFRAQVRAHVERMKEGNCSMMRDMMQGMMQGMKRQAEPKPEQRNEDNDHNSHHPAGKP